MPPTSVTLKAETVETLVNWGLFYHSLLDSVPPNGLAVLNGPRSLHLRSGIGAAEVIRLALERRGVEQLPDCRRLSHAPSPAAFSGNWKRLFPYIEALGIWVGDTWGTALERGEAEAVGRLIDLIAERQSSHERNSRVYESSPLPGVPSRSDVAATQSAPGSPETAPSATEISNRSTVSASWLHQGTQGDGGTSGPVPTAAANTTDAPFADELRSEGVRKSPAGMNEHSAPSAIRMLPSSDVAALPLQPTLDIQQMNREEQKQQHLSAWKRECPQVQVQQRARRGSHREAFVAPLRTEGQGSVHGHNAYSKSNSIIRSLDSDRLLLKQAECQSEAVKNLISISLLHVCFSRSPYYPSPRFTAANDVATGDVLFSLISLPLAVRLCVLLAGAE